MKAFIFIFCLASNAFAHSAYIAKYEMLPGLMIHPLIQTIYLQKNHSVLLEARDPQNNHLVRSYYLATLSARAYFNASNRITAVNVNSPLIDANPGDPLCMDIPQISVSVIKGGQEKITYKSQNCHEFNLQDRSADPINQVMKGFAELRDFQ